MAEASVITFDYKEIATLLVKQQNIREGLWCVYIKFGINAANMGSTSEDVKPTAIVPVLEIGIQKTDKPTNLTVDAATINPPAKKTARKAK